MERTKACSARVDIAKAMDTSTNIIIDVLHILDVADENKEIQVKGMLQIS
jgi:hypothetical protein